MYANSTWCVCPGWPGSALPATGVRRSATECSDVVQQQQWQQATRSGPLHLAAPVQVAQLVRRHCGPRQPVRGHDAHAHERFRRGAPLSRSALLRKFEPFHHVTLVPIFSSAHGLQQPGAAPAGTHAVGSVALKVLGHPHYIAGFHLAARGNRRVRGAGPRVRKDRACGGRRPCPQPVHLPVDIGANAA